MVKHALPMLEEKGKLLHISLQAREETSCTVCVHVEKFHVKCGFLELKKKNSKFITRQI